MDRLVASILWRRLDEPGHDACRLYAGDGGHALDGTAVFREGGAISRLDYRVRFDDGWRTRDGVIRGWTADRVVEHTIVRAASGWTMDGVAVPELDDLVDLDLGFTPATNLSQIRRIDLAPGASVDVPVAWIDLAEDRLSAMSQHYERLTATTYRYESPTFDYEAVLDVDEHGFVRRYPSLWEAE
jgi:hypothetical protein